MKITLGLILLGLSIGAQAQMFEVRKSYEVEFPSIAEREVRFKSYLDEVDNLFKSNTRASMTKACKLLGAINYDFAPFKDALAPLEVPAEALNEIEGNFHELFRSCVGETSTLPQGYVSRISSTKKGLTRLLNPYREHDQFDKKIIDGRSSYVLDGLVNIVSSLNYPTSDHEKNKNKFCFISGFYTAFYIDSRSAIKQAFNSEINNVLAKSSDKFFSTYCKAETVETKVLAEYSSNLKTLVRQLETVKEEWPFEDW